DLPQYREATDGIDLPAPVIGGKSRQESARKGLEALAAHPPAFVLIHDAARPFVDSATIDRVLAALREADAVLPAMPVADTLKRGTGSPPVVGETLDRRDLWRAQTPQGFAFAAILAAHRTAGGVSYTDDTAVAEAAGMSVALVAGNEDNFKITTPDDLRRAERIAGAMSGDIRIGNGYDVHAFGDGDRVVLCGVEIAHDRGLTGHSDADVALHAVTDALLGALADGDIGAHFPPSDPQWKGADSRVFLAHAAGLVSERGGTISNVDLTIICEAPKIAPHRDAMRASIAGILGIDIGRVGVKATTTEGLGFTGRREGIAAQASAVVRLP
ncbi:MAG: bifunctional 2-C-methyl-D-erythritol 4-phosphate cytidylyltransferase/2-C-methyl-D-erythritol 2,4-cyclodiphosphate synthase, partial [Proteobacteria bacterium]|nr:bifunctional 2-C-methyl-D-erythritol 4-phosphate cytidylyltransferase/2-C-methyl-D-erythritol 2,4-cyclodiphosphate synthase [Pseudomonadota bacterium]